MEQLLPGTPGCVVIVTSRCDLGGLIVTHGARRCAVHGLAAHHANELLVRIVGADRVRAEPDAAGHIARLCGHLPLALRIAAANLASWPSVSLAQYASDLDDADRRLDKLAVPRDTQVAVRAAFALSYAALAVPLKRAFRLLGLISGPDFSTCATATLLGVPDQDAEELLDRLTAANLIERRDAGRYGLHDLIRLYAAERATTDEPEPAREAARRRLLDWYLHSAHAAITARPAMVTPPALPEPGDGIRPQSFMTDRDALAWLDEERANLVAAISDAADSGSCHAWLLAGVLRTYFDSQCHFDEWFTALSAGLRAAEHADPLSQVKLHNDLGVLYWVKSHYPDAIASFNSALRVGTESGVHDIEGRVLNNLGAVHNELSMLTEAAHYLNRALDSQKSFATDDQSNRATILANLGEVYSNLGEFESAVRSASESLTIARGGGARNRCGEALALEVLGNAYLSLGELELAFEHLSRSLDIFRKAGFRAEEGYLLERISTVHHAAGRYTLALNHGHIALNIFREIDNHRYMANAHNSIGASLYRLDHPEKAFEHFSTARDLIDGVNYPKGQIAALTGLALAGHKTDTNAGYGQYAEQALILAQQTQQVVLQGKALDALALISLTDGRYTDALVYGEQAIAIYRRTGCRGMLADALAVHGTAQAAQGR